MAPRSMENASEAVETEAAENDIASTKIEKAGAAENEESASAKTEHALEKSNLLNKELDGQTGEAIAKTVIENQTGCLKSSDGEAIKVQGVAYGQYDGVHGIDLVAADQSGKPVIIEVKEVQNNPAHLNEKSLSSLEAEYGEVKQMDDTWVKDRWIKLIDNEDHVDELRQAGVSPKYLNPANFEKHPEYWDDILKNKTVAVVSPEGTDAVTNHLREQCDQRNISQILTIRTPAR